MTTPLDAETKRLRAMTLGQLADGYGTRKAAIADEEERLEVLKLEILRRKAAKASGELFDITVTPAGERRTLDAAKINGMFRPEYVDEHLTKTSPTGPVVRCTARKAAAAKAAAATRQAA